MSAMAERGAHWDTIPSEVVLGICKFLSTLDLLNFCAAYPPLGHLIMNTSNLWRTVHLPFPDPLLHKYRGWREYHPAPDSSSLPASSSSPPISRSQLEHEYGPTVIHDERRRSLSEPDYYSLPDIAGGEHDRHNENTAWVILDVMDFIPLHFIRHLSFEGAPCRLCVLPCRLRCGCECHQDEEGLFDHQQYGLSEHQDEVHSVRSPLAPLPQSLQNIFETGQVNFSKHIDLQSMDRFQDSSGNYVYEHEGGRVLEAIHRPTIPLSDSQTDQLESDRRQAETRTAYQRARLLIRILSKGNLSSLETLCAPWWSASSIYIIRQLLERWSFTLESAFAASTVSVAEEHRPGLVEDESSSMAVDRYLSFVSWHARWTNSIPTHGIALQPQQQIQTIARLQGRTRHRLHRELIFPLPSLERFKFRSGGVVASHERHSLAMSALVLTGRTSSSSSAIETSLPALVPITPFVTSPPPMISFPVSNLPLKATFQNCRHCGFMYLITSSSYQTCHCQTTDTSL